MKRLKIKTLEEIKGGQMSENNCAVAGVVAVAAMSTGNVAIAVFAFGIFLGGGCSQ
ncbi:MAG: hypothetical protein ABJK11_12585 [Balneola sp.]